MLLPHELAALARWCEEHQVQLVSDEIYHGIEYAPTAATIARSAWETSREAVVFASFSKYFSMTGWRIGWMLVPDRLRRAVDVLTGNFTICPPVIAQRACLAAFEPASYDELDGHVRRYAGNRRLLLDRLPQLGITELAPADGAFYIYADVGHLTDDSMAFAHDLLARTGVAFASGVDFDTAEGHRFIRFTFAGPEPDIRRRWTGCPQSSDPAVSRPVTGHPLRTSISRRRTDMYGDTQAIRALARDDARAGRRRPARGRPPAAPAPRRCAGPGGRRRRDARPGPGPVERADAGRRPARGRRRTRSSGTPTRWTGSRR